MVFNSTRLFFLYRKTHVLLALVARENSSKDNVHHVTVPEIATDAQAEKALEGDEKFVREVGKTAK